MQNSLGETGTISIHISRRMLSKLFLGALGVVVAGLFLTIGSEVLGQFLTPWLGTIGPSLFFRVVGPLGIVVFGWCGLVAVQKWCDPNPALILDEIGLIDNSSGLAAGRVPWSDVTGLESVTIFRQRFLIV